MKIHIVTSDNLLIGLDVARILGADIALAEKPGDKTAAYILTKVGGDLMSQTVLRKHNSVDAGCDFFLILSDLNGSKGFLESKFSVEYLLVSDELEKAISLTVKKILAYAIALHDLEWFGWWTGVTSQATGIDTMRVDLAFMEKVRAMRTASVISATPKEVREMAEEILTKHPKADWDRLASEKGHSLINQES